MESSMLAAGSLVLQGTEVPGLGSLLGLTPVTGQVWLSASLCWNKVKAALIVINMLCGRGSADAA